MWRWLTPEAIRTATAIQEAKLCNEYAEACLWWAELQETKPKNNDTMGMIAWLALVRLAYKKVEHLASRTGLRGLSAKDKP